MRTDKIKALLRPIKNKKGFTFIEAIAVVAIMGILAVVIGSLVGSGTTAYMRQKNKAAAKEISNIVSKEVERKMTSAREIYLINGDLPDSTFTEGGNKYILENAPFGDERANASAFYAHDGILLYVDHGNDAISYFSETDAEKKAFYSLYTMDMHVQGISDGTGKVLSVVLFIDVYKDGKIEYDDPGRVITFIESAISAESIVHSVSAKPEFIHTSDTGTQRNGTYIDLLTLEAHKNDLFTHIYFVNNESWNG